MNDSVENGTGPIAAGPLVKPEEAGKGLLSPARNWLLPGSQTLFLGILALIACFAVARTLQPVLMPLAFAWVLSAMLAPMVRKLTGWKVPHGLAVAFAIILTVFLFFRAEPSDVARFPDQFPSRNRRVRGLERSAARVPEARFLPNRRFHLRARIDERTL